MNYKELAQQPINRPGARDLDMTYAHAVYDARMRVELDKLVEANPTAKHVWFPTTNPQMGFVRND